MNLKLEAALAYGRMGWRIFPCHSVVQGPAGPACSCGHADCKSPGKHPRTRRGLREASADERQIRSWWAKWSDANIALATGGGLAVIDIDGEAGSSEFKALVATHGAVPETLTASTGRGLHLVFSTRDGNFQIRNSARGNVHVRGEGGYIIVAPSQHISGRTYSWVRKVPIAEMPKWLREWSQGFEISTRSPVSNLGLGPLPAHLANRNQRDITSTAQESLKAIWSPSEQARLISALSAIPPVQYDTWFTVGMALQALGWERSDGTDIGFTIWDEWSQLYPDKYSLGACEDKWKSFGRSDRAGVTLGTVYHLARQHGWNGGLEPRPNVQAPQHLNGHATTGLALPAAFSGPQAIIFPDVNESGLPRATMTNAKVAISALGVSCRYDLFHNRMLVAGELISKWNSTELSDHVTAMLRDMIRYRYGFDPNKANTQDACETLCLQHRFDPVLDYLDSLQWDGTPRLDTWLARYLGAPHTELNTAIGSLVLIAAVRRARSPGTKFDQIVVLEGKQGRGKSEAIRILAGSENFSDQKILGVDDRKQQELTEGVWLYEIAEMTGLRRAEVEHVKAFVSRTVDRARPAYGRYTVAQPRRTVFFGSTNQDVYLQDDTGNRRFWPVATGFIDLAALARDRDQLWAEAGVREAAGQSHVLPERLWAIAGEEQESRSMVDEWLVPINDYIALKGLTHCTVLDVLTDNQFLQMQASQVGQKEQNRAAGVLRSLGFVRRQKRLPSGKRIWHYEKAG